MSLNIRIKRTDHSYPVVIAKTEAQLPLALKRLKLVKKRATILIDEGFAKARPQTETTLRKLFPEPQNLFISVKGDESSKSWDNAGAILGQMIDAQMTRHDYVIAVGGGVTGDLGGFIASLYHRGMDVVHIPTTLLAMVDSSIGGKTAVNHIKGKNLIGTFHQPKAVITVLEFIKTLPREDYTSGLGEVFKYAVGFSPKLFTYLSKNANKVLARDEKALINILNESVAIKAKIVAQDEKEMGGAKTDRRLLNLGHTMGHGIEKVYGLPHGVAVAVGVVLAVKLSVKLRQCSQKCYDQVMELAQKLQIKTDLSWEFEKVLPFVKRDKKLVGERLQFICVKGIGKSFVRPTRIEELAVLHDQAGRDQRRAENLNG